MRRNAFFLASLTGQSPISVLGGFNWKHWKGTLFLLLLPLLMTKTFGQENPQICVWFVEHAQLSRISVLSAPKSARFFNDFVLSEPKNAHISRILELSAP